MRTIWVSAVLYFFVGWQVGSALAATAHPEVQQALQRQRLIDEALTARDMQRCTAALSNLQQDLASNRTLQGSPSYSQLLQHYQAAEARYMRMGGGHVLKLYGDGQRVTKVSPAGFTAAQDALAACRAAADYTNYGFSNDAEKFRSLYGAYEGKIARALQIDRNAFRSGNTLIMLAVCEWETAHHGAAIKERLQRARSGRGGYEICWYVERDMKEDPRSGRFMAASTSNTPRFIEVLCAQAPTRSTVSGKLLEAMQGWHLRPTDVVVKNGDLRNRPEVSGQKVPIVAVRVYSRNGTPGPIGRQR